MRIAIFDPVAPKPYSLASLRTQPIGGTEATVVRIAEALDATVLQHNRQHGEGRYQPMHAIVNPDVVIALREAAAALQISAQYPSARTLLWLHDLAAPTMDRGKRLHAHGRALAAACIDLVCVSDFHAAQVRENFSDLPAEERPRVVRMYNPVDVSSVASESIAVDPNKLVFFSSPHKGLEYTLDVFARMVVNNPALRLYIANPGYLPDAVRRTTGIENIGSVPHHEIMRHVKSALCTFYPNYIYPETFGLALAESNALGTPVLAHDIGAANEVLNGSGQFVRVPATRGIVDSAYWRWPHLRQRGEAALGRFGCFSEYENTIRRWQQGGRPVVSGRSEFSIEAVTRAWRELFEKPSASLATLAKVSHAQ